VSGSSPRHLDPTASYWSNEAAYTYQIYEPPYGYHYLKRPFELVPKAAEARDALVKFLYGNLFQSIIDQINLSLATSQTSADHTNIIGVLFFDHPVSLCFFVVVVVVE
jgi:hypothetical protein